MRLPKLLSCALSTETDIEMQPKDMHRWNPSILIAAGLVMGLALFLTWPLQSVAPAPTVRSGFVQWLYDWQTLIAGGMALAGAIATVHVVRTQIAANRSDVERQIRAEDVRRESELRRARIGVLNFISTTLGRLDVKLGFDSDPDTAVEVSMIEGELLSATQIDERLGTGLSVLVNNVRHRARGESSFARKTAEYLAGDAAILNAAIVTIRVALADRAVIPTVLVEQHRAEAIWSEHGLTERRREELLKLINRASPANVS